MDEELDNITCDNLEPDFENPINIAEISQTKEDYKEIPKMLKLIEESSKLEPG